MAEKDALDISYQLESIEVAAECISGDLKHLAFGKFLKRATELLVSLASSEADGIWISIAGSFLKYVYEKASEIERIKFAELIHNDLCVVSHLVEVTCLIWKGEVSLQDEPARGVCALLEVLLECYNDGCKVKVWLQKQKYPMKILQSIKIYLDGREICKMGSIANFLLRYCLEIVCLCADNRVSCKQYSEAGCLQLMQQLSNISVPSVCLTSKALAGLIVANSDESTPEFVTLTDNELKMLLDILHSGSDFSLGISKCVVTSLLKGLMECEQNTAKFKQCNLLSLLQQKIETLKLSIGDEILDSLQGVSRNSSTKAISSQTDNQDSHGDVDLVDYTEVDAQVEKQIVAMASNFTEYFVKLMLRLDIPGGMLSSAEFDNVAAVLLLIEELISESSEREKEDIKYAICGISDIAKSATLLMEHLDDQGTSTIFRRCSLRVIMTVMMDLTDYSLKMCKELGLTGFVAYLLTFLDVSDKTAMMEEGVAGLIQLILTVILNCANEPSNLPVFEASDAAERIIPYLQCPIFDIAFLGKMILSYLTSHLTNEQFLYLELEAEEAEYLVSLFSKAVEAPDFRAEGNSITEILKFLINFSRLYGEEIEEDVDDKQLKKKMSNFKSNYRKRKGVSHNNIQMITVVGILSPLETLLALPNIDPSVMVQTLQLLWNLIHLDSFVKAMSSSLRETITCLQCPPDPEIQSLVLCIRWLLGDLDKEDMSICLQYARTCFTYCNFDECITTCMKAESQLVSVGQEAAFTSDIKLMFGKAMYHAYQPELWHLIKRRDYLSIEEIKLVSAECFVKMRKVISLLGNALDNENIDFEGSKLLDFAMTSCAFDLNSLHLCGRCLLCRRGSQKLRKGHLWPNSILKRIYKSDYEGYKKPFLFGSKPRSGKECTIYMFCPSCEELLSQNGEEQFAKFLDCLREQPLENYTYGSWLYNFAIGMMFRQLSTESMSYFINSHEVYNTFILCRKHLFTLNTKMSNKILPPLSEASKYQFQRICMDATGDVSIFMMHCNAKLVSSKDEMIHYFGEYCHCSGSIATCQLVNAKLDLSGRAHFVVVYCNGIQFLLTFEASESFSIPRHFLIHQQPSESQLCVIPTKDVAPIPDGVWSVLRQLGAISFKSRMDCYQTISERTLQILNTPSYPSIQMDSEKGRSSHQLELLHIAANSISNTGPAMLTLPSFYSFSLLPTDYQVRVCEKPIQLPMGHKVILHLSGKIDELLQTCFLCVNEEILDFYVIIVYSDAESDLQLIEGVSISTEDEPKVIKFLLEERPGLEKLPHPFSIDDMQMYIGEQVPHLLYSKGIKSMAQLMQLIKCRRSIDATEAVPSLDTKCHPNGCWYCKNLCDCCMRQVPLWTGREAEQNPGILTLSFCGEECEQFVHPKPGSPPKVSAIYHKKKPGKVIGPAKLQVTKSMLSPGVEFSQLEFIELCISDGSEGIPPEKPYVIWQIRSVDSQKVMDFFIDSNFVPVKCLWTSKFPQLNVSLQDSVLKGRLCDLLTNVLALVLKKLGHDSLDSFVLSNLPHDSSPR